MKIKRSVTNPLTSLPYGELAVSFTDGRAKFYLGNSLDDAIELNDGVNIKDFSITPDKFSGVYVQLDASSLSISSWEGLDNSSPAVRVEDNELLEFANAGTTYAWKKIRLGSNWTGSNINFSFDYSSPGSGNGQLFLRAKAVKDNENVSAIAWGTAVPLVKTAGTANNSNYSTNSGNVTVANSPTAGDKLFIQIYRNAADGSDTLDNVLNLEDLTLYL